VGGTDGGSISKGLAELERTGESRLDRVGEPYDAKVLTKGIGGLRDEYSHKLQSSYWLPWGNGVGGEEERLPGWANGQVMIR